MRAGEVNKVVLRVTLQSRPDQVFNGPILASFLVNLEYRPEQHRPELDRPE
jgi:hypothetical protein